MSMFDVRYQLHLNDIYDHQQQVLISYIASKEEYRT